MRFLLALALAPLGAFAAPGDLRDFQELAPFTPATIQQAMGRFCSNWPPLPQNKIGNANIRVFAVQYETTDVNGQPTVASGAVMVPDTGSGAFSIVSYQHGTVLKHDDVPSHENHEGLAAGACYGSQGYAVVAADYLGYGVSTLAHPYLHVATEATASADMLRAARQLAPRLKITFGPKLFLAGYSQGGGSTMALHKYLQEKLSGEFTVTASTPMAGPYDLEKSFLTVIHNPTPHSVTEFSFHFVTSNGIYHYAGPVTDYVKEPWASKLGGLFDGSHDWAEVMKALPTSFDEFLAPGFAAAVTSDANHPYRRALRENNVNDWVPAAPMLLIQGEADHEVPTSNTSETCAAMKRARGPVDCFLIPGMDHAYGFISALPISIGFFNSK